MRLPWCSRAPAVLFVLAGLSIACGGGQQADPSMVSEPELESACLQPPAEQSSPRSIEEVVSQLNAMPKPVTLPCFVETLERPLAVAASKSIFSAQPAKGERSPRIFLFSDPLIMTVVPEGTGSHLLELGQLRSETHSLKAEIAFPVEIELDPSEPFQRILFDESLTNCQICHAEEEPDASIAFTSAFVSRALRPTAGQLVSVESLGAEVEPCNALDEPERCALLHAIFDWGGVAERQFPEAMPTFP